jgi:polysaccharide chain length determinant protein (PEP-CTERM system associated)
MINPEKKYTLQEYIEILNRRMWYLIIPFLLIVFVASVYSIAADKRYKASTLVLVTPQRVPEAFVQATVTSKVEERLQSISQEVMSRTRLEQIIAEYKLYEKESRSRSKEELVDLMRSNINVELPTKKDEKGYFTISFTGDNPQVVTTIANRLASLFIEENLRIREQQAVGTTEFLSIELKAAKKKLDEMETAVTAYKTKYMGELPEQREANIKILEQLQNQNLKVSESLRAAQDRKLVIQKQLMEMPAAVELEDLRAKYTENHPDVIAAKKKYTGPENKSGYDTHVRKDPRYRELRSQLDLTDLEIRRLARESANLSGQVETYLSRIEKSPAREQDMAALMREYSSTKQNYETLLKKNQDAIQAENLEKRQKGEQFRVIDPARVPEKPFSPDIPKTMLISLLAGLGAGLAAVFLREQMDRSFYDATDVEITLGIKVLATIPKIEDETA